MVAKKNPQLETVTYHNYYFYGNLSAVKIGYGYETATARSPLFLQQRKWKDNARSHGITTWLCVGRVYI